MTVPVDTMTEAATMPPNGGGLFRDYVSKADVFDEMREPGGSLRPHWQMFVNSLNDLGPAELERRWNTSRQLIHDNGVTYNVYGDPAGMDRPWNLDAIPFVLAAHEWAELEAGLVQRAKLLDALLADVYGQQVTVCEGLIPPELIF